MTTEAVGTIVYGNVSAPAGTVVGGILCTFTAQNNPANTATQTVPPGTATVTQALNADTYIATFQAQDSSSPPNLIGSPVTATPSPFVITGANVTISIPVSAIIATQ
jgi:hypothetical protein